MKEVIFATMMVFLYMMFITCIAWIASDKDQNYNSPELRQCLSQSGTTWQGGECVIILNK